MCVCAWQRKCESVSVASFRLSLSLSRSIWPFQSHSHTHRLHSFSIVKLSTFRFCMPGHIFRANIVKMLLQRSFCFKLPPLPLLRWHPAALVLSVGKLSLAPRSKRPPPPAPLDILSCFWAGFSLHRVKLIECSCSTEPVQPDGQKRI